METSAVMRPYREGPCSLCRVGKGQAAGEFTGHSVHGQVLEQSRIKQESRGTKLVLPGDGTRLRSASRAHTDDSRPCRSAGALGISPAHGHHALLSLGLTDCCDSLLRVHSQRPSPAPKQAPCDKLGMTGQAA